MESIPVGAGFVLVEGEAELGTEPDWLSMLPSSMSLINVQGTRWFMINIRHPTLLIVSVCRNVAIPKTVRQRGTNRI